MSQIENGVPGGAFGQWWRRANKAQREALCAALGQTASVARHLAAGRNTMSVAMAVKLEAATLVVDGIEPLTRTQLRSECAECPYVLACARAAEEGEVSPEKVSPEKVAAVGAVSPEKLGPEVEV